MKSILQQEEAKRDNWALVAAADGEAKGKYIITVKLNIMPSFTAIPVNIWKKRV